MLATVRSDLLAATRSLWRSPGFTLTTIAMLSIGIGLAIYMFGAIQSYLLRELPFPDAAELMHVEYVDSRTQSDSIEVPVGDFRLWRRELRHLQAIEAFTLGTINLSSDEDRPERYDGAFVSAGSFRTLGVSPLLGPGFQEGDDRYGAPATVVIGHDLWQQRFNGDPDIVGKTLRVNGQPASVVGVMPQGFAFPFNNAVWAPLTAQSSLPPRGTQQSVEVFARLTPGSSLGEASAELDAALTRIEQADSNTPVADRVIVKPYKEEFVGGGARQTIVAMFLAVLLVLAIACVNVANLMIARGVQRGRESAIRSAIGASRARLVMLALNEALLIALAAVIIGSTLALIGGQATMDAIRTSANAPPYWVTVYRFDAISAMFATAIAAVVVLLAGLWPAWRSARVAQAEGMKEGGRSTGTRLGNSLTIVEIALCMVLLVCAGLTIRAVIQRQNLPLAYEAKQVLSGRVGLFEGDYPDLGAVGQFTDSLRQRLAALPGVEAAGITSSLPMTGSAGDYISIEGTVDSAETPRPAVMTVSADPGFFTALSIPLQRGRLFDGRDVRDAPPVAVVSEVFAQRFWPAADALGKRFRLGEPGRESDWIEIVGVIAHIPHNNGNREVGALYLPFAQKPTRFFSPVLRVSGDPLALAESVRTTVVDLDRNLPVYFLRTLDEWAAIAAFNQRLMAALFSLFGAFAVLLAAAGLYAVLAYQVSQRVREIGVRRALGANDSGIARLVLNQGIGKLVVGAGIGLVLAFGFAQLLSGLLFGVSAFDPVTYLGVVVILALVTLCASLLPTRRALRIAPIVALRHE